MTRIVLITAAAAAIAFSTAGAWLAGGGTALAPEPLMLTQTLNAGTGATAAGYFINSSVSGAAVKWPGTWTANTSLDAGTPCSTIALGAGYQVNRFIQATGNYRRCA